MIKIPLVPQWNLYNGCVCTPDGGFLYAGSRSINFISSVESDKETPLIKCFHTRQGILSLDVDPHWGQPGRNGNFSSSENLDTKDAGGENVVESVKFFAALLQDNSVQIWDFNKGCAIQGHKAHLAYMRYMEGNGPSPQHAGEVLISYMCNRNVLSVDNQDIVVYCVASNSFYRRAIFISSRNHQMTALKCSPYSENLFAVGTKRGLVLLCDLQKMVILYTLRGHDYKITSIAWNRIDLSLDISTVACGKELENVKSKTEKPHPKPAILTRSDATNDTDEIFDIYDYNYLDNEFGAPSHEMKIRNDFVSDFIGVEKKSNDFSTTAKFDFAEACQSLKEEINCLRDELPETSPEHVISLEECKEVGSKRNDLSSCDSEVDAERDGQNKAVFSDKESLDGSVVRLVCRSPSSEESVDVDGMHRNQQNFICQAVVHQMDLSQDNEVLTSCETLISHTNDDHAEMIGTTELSKTDKEKMENTTECLKPKESYDILLATSSADGTFCIWNTTTGATCHSQKIRSSPGGKNMHIEVSWISSTSIMINNRAGELQLWSMQPVTNKQLPIKSSNRMYKFKEIKRCWLQRSVVSFSCSSKQHLLWSISTHREVCMENIKLNKVLINYSCVSTNIGAMQECPDDMNKIALGFSDRRIGIIDISKMTPTSVRIENFVQRVESNVMSLVWSPDCKRVAYGTMEGRIGIINIEALNKQPFNFNSICGRPIYCMRWQDRFLYVVCNERIAVYEDDPNKKDAHIIPNIENVSCVSLRNKYLFVGTQNGQLQLFVHTEGNYLQYEVKKTLHLASRYISEISWSPIITNQLAVVANANNIHILEFNSETADIQIKRKIDINSPKSANGFVKWSNRSENYILTCGFDGAIRVFNLSNENNPEYFVKTYHCPMTCGLFLPTDEEIIICSGKSAALEFIDMRLEKSESTSGKSKRPHPKTLDNVKWATKALTRNDVKPQTAEKKLNRCLAKTSENKLEDKTTSCTTTDVEEVSTIMENLILAKTERPLPNESIYMKNPATVLYLTTKEINKDALELMFSMLDPLKTNENKCLIGKLFATKAEAKELLAEELENHQRSETKGISNLLMPQLKGNLKDQILKAVQNKQLCEWQVSLAPSISYSFWQKCCQAYAEQLMEQGYALQAASYMLAIHQQQDAIEMLMEKKYFKEASLIARIYLQPEDPINNSISEQWITYLCANGNLTGAALLCLLTKQNNRAYECLAKIRNTGPEIERVIRLLKSSAI